MGRPCWPPSAPHAEPTEDREKIGGLLGKLVAADFATREGAYKQLLALGQRSLPQLREAAKDKNPDVARAGQAS